MRYIVNLGRGEVALMRGIARLLFGKETGILSELFAQGDGDGDGFGMAERARRSGEWCGSTPGRGGADGAVADALRGARSPQGRGQRGTFRF
jgi:hypothetical protein